MEVCATEFKAKYLKLMNQVNNYHEEIIITKYGKPIAKLVPVSKKASKSLFGYMKDTVKINSDILKPIDEKWDVDK